jgi:hypothetical protein
MGGFGAVFMRAHSSAPRALIQALRSLPAAASARCVPVRSGSPCVSRRLAGVPVRVEFVVGAL